MTVRRVGAKLFNVDGRTGEELDRSDEASSRISQFCDGAPKKKHHWNLARSWNGTKIT